LAASPPTEQTWKKSALPSEKSMRHFSATTTEMSSAARLAAVAGVVLAALGLQHQHERHHGDDGVGFVHGVHLCLHCSAWPVIRASEKS
jgi:hypothetical protein